MNEGEVQLEAEAVQPMSSSRRRFGKSVVLIVLGVALAAVLWLQIAQPESMMRCLGDYEACGPIATGENDG